MGRRVNGSEHMRNLAPWQVGQLTRKCDAKDEEFRIKFDLSAGAKFKEEVDRERCALWRDIWLGPLEQFTPKCEPKIAFLLHLFFLLK